MPRLESPPVGGICWTELITNDLAGAREFYDALFGWNYEEQSFEPGYTYTMVFCDGLRVGGIYDDDLGRPPHWRVFVRVENVDEAARRAVENGGVVLTEPTDVPGQGRMALFADPAGAQIAAWEAHSEGGVQLSDEPGSPCWCELLSNDTAGAEPFYRALFEWNAKKLAMGSPDYSVFSRDKEPRAGLFPIPVAWGEQPDTWLLYFAVDDCDAAVQRAEGAGGVVVTPPTDIPDVGRFAILQDPAGAEFGIIRLSSPKT